MKPLLFFDLDGTLTDSAPGIFHAIRFAQEQAHLRELDEKELCSCVGPPLRDSFMRLWNVSEEKADFLVETYRVYYRQTGIYENAPYPGVRDMLETLRPQAEMRICSAKPTEMVRTVLSHFDLLSFFSSICAADLHGPFPGKGVFLTSSREQGRPAAMIGDRSDDMIGACEAKVTGIGALWGYGSREELLSGGASYLIEKPCDLPPLIETLFH